MDPRAGCARAAAARWRRSVADICDRSNPNHSPIPNRGARSDRLGMVTSVPPIGGDFTPGMSPLKINGLLTFSMTFGPTARAMVLPMTKRVKALPPSAVPRHDSHGCRSRRHDISSATLCSAAAASMAPTHCTACHPTALAASKKSPSLALRRRKTPFATASKRLWPNGGFWLSARINARADPPTSSSPPCRRRAGCPRRR